MRYVYHRNSLYTKSNISNDDYYNVLIKENAIMGLSARMEPIINGRKIWNEDILESL
jgi:hypothetical protein